MIDLSTIVKDVTTWAQAQTLTTSATTALFEALLPDALANATTVENDGTVFVKTGDIPAMWLRDATFQILPYVALIKVIPALLPLLEGVLKKELRCVQHDPYANAFNQTASGAHWSDDRSDILVSPLVWERKYEIDSLCAPLLLALRLVDATKSTRVLDTEFWHTLEVIVTVFEREQHHDTSPYFFDRDHCPANDTLAYEGKGTPIGYTGMIWNGFRPSDNACELGYHIPANLFVVAMFKELLPYLPKHQAGLAQRMRQLIQAIETGVAKYGYATLSSGQTILAYEVDGLGNQLLMDDANVPSLLSLPFLGAMAANDPLYMATRAYVLSANNPYYYTGTVLSGMGSNHTPKGYVWPIAIAMVGLTTDDRKVQAEALAQIAATDAQTGQCHESVSADEQTQYTREWFSWANMTYCQLGLTWLGQR
jgi:meiotically up-regulated gene 157 (Mug157) protein